MSRFKSKKNRLSLLGAYLRKKDRFNAGPAVLTVETTTRCNLSCPTCFRQHDSLPEQDMPMDLFRKIFDRPESAFDTIHLFGMGEPLMDPHLPDRIELCSQKAIQTHIATNATLLDDNATESLLDAGLSAITFSIDSPHPEIYQSLRPGARYGQVVRNVLGFIEKAKTRKRRPMMFVQMLRTRNTRRDVGLARKFWMSRGVDDIRICYDEFYSSSDPFAKGKNLAVESAPCLFLWQGPGLVRANGGLYPCCCSGLNSEPFANLNDTSIYEFWTGDNMRDMRNRQLSGQRYPGIDCYACRSQKPIPLLAYMSYLVDGMSARRWGIRIERLMHLTRWRMLYREIR